MSRPAGGMILRMYNHLSGGAYPLKPTDDDRAFLYREWLELATRHEPAQERAARLYSLVAECYSEEDRFYHNLRHVAELLRLLADFECRAGDYDAMRFAGWFHDVVYDTRRGDNEERSAEFAARVLQELNVPAPTAARARAMILATKGHAARGCPPDALLLLDADLSILGAPSEMYEQYSRAIRMEYSWVDEAAYRRGRREVLECLLRRERVYQTAEMFGRFEERARRNLGREIELLS